MLAIRLRKTGSKKRPFFRVVVTDSQNGRDSSFVEVLGFYNPRTAPETLKLDLDRLGHWVSKGAVPSDTVRTLVARMPETPAGDEAPAEPSAGASAKRGSRAEASATAESPAGAQAAADTSADASAETDLSAEASSQADASAEAPAKAEQPAS